MKEYEFVEIAARGGFATSKIEGHREIIERYALQGYQYVGYVPTKFNSYGSILKMDLVFEKDMFSQS